MFNLWKLSVTVIILLLDQLSYCAPPTSVDCSGRNVDLPVVKVYDASPPEPDYENNGTVTLKKPEGDQEEDTIGWIGLECEHTKPVRWVFNLDFEQSGLGDSYSHTSRKIQDFYNPRTYSFQASVELKVHVRNKRFVFMCAAIDDTCKRRVVETFFDKEEGLYILRSLPKQEENDTSVRELASAIVRNQNWGQADLIDSRCGVNFSLIDLGDRYNSLFTPLGIREIKPRVVPSRQTLENAYLFHEHLNRGCIKDECSKENPHCFTTPKIKASLYWPIVFFMQGEKGISRVVHTYHTLKKDNDTVGQLKFAWEYSNPKDFLSLDPLPRRVFLDEPINVMCRLSPFMFSTGAQIGYAYNNPGSDQLHFIDVEENPVFAEAFEVSGQLAIPSTSNKTSIKVTVFCFGPIWNSSTEWVNVSREFDLIEPSVKVYGSGERVFELSLHNRFTTYCGAEGNPLPNLTIVKPKNAEIIEDDKRNNSFNWTEKTITIPNVDNTHEGFYNCVATNHKRTSFYSFQIKVKGVTVSERKTSSTLTVVLSSVFGSLSAIFIAVVMILFVRFRMEREEFRRLTEEAIRDFLEGMDASHIPPEESEHLYANDGVKIMPYDSKFEVHHRHWNFSGTMLGQGAFGLVQKGVVEVGSRKSVVAIKTVKSAEDIDDFRATLLELKIMSFIGEHPNVVRLIAASTDDIKKRKVFIGVEYCANGSLLSYLQKRKMLFTNLVKDGRIDLKACCESDNGKQEEGAYLNLVTSDISTIDLFKWSFQVASGMDFLESKKVLHADLATRNILLTEDLVAKIADFGLSRELFENSEYVKKTQVILPFKWMAPESLKWLKFSSLSDVWAYGVTLYEIFTLGEEPYPGQTWNDEFILTLDNGMRLGRPPFCTENVYNQVMMPCWQIEPSDRIRFADAMVFFEKVFSKEKR